MYEGSLLKRKRSKERRRSRELPPYNQRCSVQASRHYELKKVVCILRRWSAVAGKSPLKRSGRRIDLLLAPLSPHFLIPFLFHLHWLYSSGHLPGYKRAPKGGLLTSLSVRRNIPWYYQPQEFVALN